MTNDVEFLIFTGRLEVRRDCIELSVRGPGRAGGKCFASLPQLALTEIIRSVYEVQFVLDVGALKEFSKPLTLSWGVAGKVEDDRNSPRQEIPDVKRQDTSHSSRALDEVLEASDLAGIQRAKEFVLNEKDGVRRQSQLPRVSRFPNSHLPAHEVQPRPLLSHRAPKRLIGPAEELLRAGLMRFYSPDVR